MNRKGARSKYKVRPSGVRVFAFHWTTGRTIALTKWTLVNKITSLLFNMLSRFVIAFLPRSKCLLISWLQSPSAVMLEHNKIKSVTVSIVSPSICHEVMGPDAMILVFWMLSFKPAFSLSSFTSIKRLFSFSLLSAIRMVSSAYLRLLIFPPGKLDSSLSFIQPGILHDVLCIEVKYAGWQHTALTYSFPNFKPVYCSMSGSVSSWPAYRFLRRQVRWSSIPISKNFPECVMIQRQRLPWSMKQK